jgi:hypothetical protein
VLTVAPGTTGAGLVVLCAAGRADHQWQAPSGSVGPAHPATALGSALVLVQATPGAVLLRPGNSVSQAFSANRTCRTDRLGLAFTDIAFWLALAVRAEEEDDLPAAARGGILPAPVRPGSQCHLPTYLRHESISSALSRVFLCPAPRRTRGLALRGLCPAFHPTHDPAAMFPGNGHSRTPERQVRSGGQSHCRTGQGRVHASRPDEASQFSEPTLNNATHTAGFAAGREKYHSRLWLSPATHADHDH